MCLVPLQLVFLFPRTIPICWRLKRMVLPALLVPHGSSVSRMLVFQSFHPSSTLSFWALPHHLPTPSCTPGPVISLLSPRTNRHRASFSLAAKQVYQFTVWLLPARFHSWHISPLDQVGPQLSSDGSKIWPLSPLFLPGARFVSHTSSSIRRSKLKALTATLWCSRVVSSRTLPGWP